MRRAGSRFGRRSPASRAASPALPWIDQMLAAYPTMAWWDPSTGVTTAAGDVDSWTDRSGNGYAVTQATAGSRPTFSATSMNGHPGMGNDGSNRYLLGGAALAALIDDSAACTTFVRVKTRSVGATGLGVVAVGTLASSTSDIELAGASGGFLRYSREATGAATTNTSAATTLAVNSYYTLTTRFTGTAVSLWVNTNLETGSPFANTRAVPGLDVMSIGGRWRAAVISGFLGLWGDIVVIPASLTDQQVADGQSWMAARYV